MEKITNVISRSYRMAIAAALDAVNMSELCHYEPQRIAVIMGTSAGAICEIEENSKGCLSIENNAHPSSFLGGYSYAF